MKLKFIIILVVVLITAIIGIGALAVNFLNGLEEDQNKSASLDPSVRNLFSDNQSVEDYPYQPEKPIWKGKYIVLENRFTDTMSAKYSTAWNEELNTEINFPGKDIKGIVMIALIVDDEGGYQTKFGNKTHQKALRQSYIISYLDIAKKTIIAIDTLRGEDPPENIKSTESGLGNPPDEDLVVKTIQDRLK